jgi:hypothetical protein
MNASLRVGACAVVLLGAVLFVGCVLVPWLGGPSLFPDDLHEICQQWLEESSRSEELGERSRQTLDVLEGKREATAELIAGRASLAQTVARFRALRDQGEIAEDAGADEPAELSDEAVARSVLCWARVALRHEPCGEEVLHRLEDEFRRTYPHAALET